MRMQAIAAVFIAAVILGSIATPVLADDIKNTKATIIKPDNAGIRYSPRNWDFTKLPYEAATICTGSFFEVNLLTGNEPAGESGIDLSFGMSTMEKPLPTVGVSFDNSTVQTYPMAESIRIPLPSLPEGSHIMRVTLTNLNENLEHWKRPFKTGMMFKGMDITGATVGPKPKTPDKGILFIGDSITQGVRSRSAEKDYTSSVGDDSTLTFSTLTASTLGYDLANVGFGRLGINVIGSGGIPIAPYSVGYVCEGIPVDTGFQPELIVINLGTNDGNPDTASFDFHYRLMLSTIRKLYGNARIICLVPFGGFDKAQITKAVQGYVGGTKDNMVTLVDATKWITINKNWKPTEDTTDGIHPNQQGHRKAADQLLAVIAGMTPAK